MTSRSHPIVTSAAIGRESSPRQRVPLKGGCPGRPELPSQHSASVAAPRPYKPRGRAASKLSAYPPRPRMRLPGSLEERAIATSDAAVRAALNINSPPSLFPFPTAGSWATAGWMRCILLCDCLVLCCWAETPQPWGCLVARCVKHGGKRSDGRDFHSPGVCTGVCNLCEA